MQYLNYNQIYWNTPCEIKVYTFPVYIPELVSSHDDREIVLKATTVPDPWYFCFTVGTSRMVWVHPTYPVNPVARARITVRGINSARTPATTPTCGRTAPSWWEHSAPGSAKRTRRRVANVESSAAPRVTARTRSTITITGRKAVVDGGDGCHHLHAAWII